MAEKIRQIISQEKIDMDVVITNETSSYAVALKYRRDIDDAPRIVASREDGKKHLCTLWHENIIYRLWKTIRLQNVFMNVAKVNIFQKILLEV